jgi:hypothetical protein
MDCIDANAPTSFLRDELEAWTTAAVNALDGDMGLLLSMQANNRKPSNDKERKAQECWNIGQRLLAILDERGALPLK